MWVGDKVYFRSDRDGEFNVYSFDPATKKIARLTKHADFPVVNASAGAGKIVSERAAYLHRREAKRGCDPRLKVGVPAALVESLPRFAKGNKFVRGGSISPSGA